MGLRDIIYRHLPCQAHKARTGTCQELGTEQQQTQEQDIEHRDHRANADDCVDLIFLIFGVHRCGTHISHLAAKTFSPGASLQLQIVRRRKNASLVLIISVGSSRTINAVTAIDAALPVSARRRAIGTVR